MGQDAWEAAAERLDLRIDERTAFAARPKVLRGAVDGVDVTVRYRSSDNNTETRYHVVLPGQIPLSLIRPSWWGFLRRGRDAFGNPHWRREFVVKAPDPVAADMYLTEERGAVLDEMRSDLGLRWRVKGGELRLIRTGRASADDLERIVRSMAGYAHRLAG